MSTAPLPIWLTVADIQAELDRYTFSGLLATAQPRLELHLPNHPGWPPGEMHCGSVPVRITLYTRMPDRDTGELCNVAFQRAVPLAYFRDVAHFHIWLGGFLRESWQHELQESVRLDGELQKDPHESDSVGGL